MAAAPSPKATLFGKSSKAKAPAAGNGPEVIEQLGALSRRMKLVEEHIDSTRRKLQLDEHNLLSTGKRLAEEVKAINEELNELRRNLEDIKRTQTTIIKELGLCAKKDKFQVLQRYVEMWEPIRFVTRKEVENIIRDILAESKAPQE